MEYDNRANDAFVLFDLAGTTYAVRSGDVRQLEMIEHITPVPNASPAVDGVVLSRGEAIPAINLRTRFGLPKTELDIRTRLIVVRVGDRSIGLIVDAAREFKRIPAEAIKPPSEAFAGTTGAYLEGIASVNDRFILVLRLAEIIETADGLSAAGTEM